MTRHRPSPATLIAFAALFVALDGPGQAAQLARKVTSHHHSLRGPRGPRGLRGPAGPQGGQGAVGPRGSAAAPVVRQAGFHAQNTPLASAVASCDPGEVATGGGITLSSAPYPPIIQDRPYQSGNPSGVGQGPADGWYGELQAAPNSTFGEVYVLCVPGS